MSPTDRDELREKVARALVHVTEDGGWRDWDCCDEPRQAAFLRMADAVLAELRLEQVAFMRDDSSMMVSARGSLRGTEPPEGWVPVYIMRALMGLASVSLEVEDAVRDRVGAFLAEQENTD